MSSTYRPRSSPSLHSPSLHSSSLHSSKSPSLRSSKTSTSGLRLGPRPRSLTTSLFSTGSSPSLYKSHTSPSSSFLSGYLSKPTSTYGGTTSGYGGLTLHHSPVSSTHSLSPATSTSALYGASHRLSPRSSPVRSSPVRSSPVRVSLPFKSNSFNTGRNLSTIRSSLGSLAAASRSSSLISLHSNKSAASEGYASDWSGRSSRVNSSAAAGGDNSLGSSRATTPVSTKEDRDSTENGEPDYKRLYEESQLENERLREKLKKTEGELTESKSQIEKTSQSHASKMSLSEMEKREKRSLERKLAEMEEELKQLQKLKAENERLKAENRALTRVVSKLTNSTNATK